ncbi:hypothetical protein OHT77_00865 [Streptomyces sp. NBC_00252]|nr:hypothetical protein [Streptomyces sp. NBC_00252]
MDRVGDSPRLSRAKEPRVRSTSMDVEGHKTETVEVEASVPPAH